MKHDPALTAAPYLAGELERSERDRFEEHLMHCEDCWAEVRSARQGLTAVERTRELAPAHLRERVREAVRSAQMAVGKRRWKRTHTVATASAIAAIAAVSVLVVVQVRPPRPDPISAAVSDFKANRLPGSTAPLTPAPDLSAIRLTVMGAGDGRLEGMAVTAYAFRDATGRRLIVYTAAHAFPALQGGHPLGGAKGPWMVHRDGTFVLRARYPHQVLVVGKDDGLVHDAAVVLDVM